MNPKIIPVHMKAAESYAQLSYARRLKVGAILVKDDRIISIGYNGTPNGWDNNCEIELEDGSLKTKPEVLHAEANALMKVARSSENSEGSILFVTLSPCIECAKLIHQAGVKEVYYKDLYRNTDGLDFLSQANIPTHQIKENS